MTRAALILNPISGQGTPGRVLRDRLVLARTTLARHDVTVDAHVTAGSGDGHRLAAQAVREGAALVIAWGGDGTINEVGSALVSTNIPLGIVPAGSGNGLARDLGLPLDAEQALTVAAGAVDRDIDAGALNGELFFNVGGIGLDARVAERFAACAPEQRGFRAYARISAGELWRYRPRDYTITVAGQHLVRSALMITIANSRQFGNGALIAPRARLDDGELDLVVVQAQSLARVALHIPALFRGTLQHGRGIDMQRIRSAAIAAPGPIAFHVDGEPRVAEGEVAVTIHGRVLRVRVADPAGSRSGTPGQLVREVVTKQ